MEAHFTVVVYWYVSLHAYFCKYGATSLIGTVNSKGILQLANKSTLMQIKPIFFLTINVRDSCLKPKKNLLTWQKSRKNKEMCTCFYLDCKPV